LILNRGSGGTALDCIQRRLLDYAAASRNKCMGRRLVVRPRAGTCMLRQPSSTARNLSWRRIGCDERFGGV